MRAFLVTDTQAGKLPRWALLLLCVLYALPGFIGRDPWRHDDAASFGVALSMARGTLTDWWLPNVAGQSVFAEGPAPYWAGALLARILPDTLSHAAVKSMAVIGLFWTLAALWSATYRLARRPGVLPSDPLGASASRTDFARAVADSALLLVLASLGAIARLHETTAESAQVLLIALFLQGAALALERPRLGALVAGLAIGMSVMTRGLLPAGALLFVALLLPVASRDFRLVLHGWLGTLLPVALGLGTLWPLSLAYGSPAAQAHLQAWLAWNGALLQPLSVGDLAHLLRTLPWFFWPTWPIALWAFIRWSGRRSVPAIAAPGLTALAFGTGALLSGATPDAQLLAATLPLAMIASLGLPTLRRSVVSLIDWFAVMTFTVIGLAVWAYWISFLIGWPPRMALSAARIAPGYSAGSIVLDAVLGIVATLSWLWLVRWRVARHPPMLWRSVVLSSGGLVLAWFLLMTMWLPAFNQRNTYREVSQRAAAALPPDYDCLETREVGLAQRASLFYFGPMRFARSGQSCHWLLVQDVGPLARTTASPPPGYVLLWEGSRVRDNEERLRLYGPSVRAAP